MLFVVEGDLEEEEALGEEGASVSLALLSGA